MLDLFFFFFNDTATTEIYTLSLHDALPIYHQPLLLLGPADHCHRIAAHHRGRGRSEEHTSELQSPCNLVCRLLLEKKKKKTTPILRLTIIPYTSSLVTRLILFYSLTHENAL